MKDFLTYQNNRITSPIYENIEAWGCHILSGNFTLSVYYGEGMIDIEVNPTINSTPYGEIEFMVEFPTCTKTFIYNVLGGTSDEFYVSPSVINFTENGQFETITVSSNMLGSILLGDTLSNNIELSLETIGEEYSQDIEVTSISDETYSNLPITISLTGINNTIYTSQVLVSQKTETSSLKDVFNVSPSIVNVSNLDDTFTIIVQSYKNGESIPYTISGSDSLEIIDQTLNSITLRVNNNVTANTAYTLTFTQEEGKSKSVKVNYTYISTNCIFAFGKDETSTSETETYSVTSKDNYTQSFNVYSKKGEDNVRWFILDYPSEYVTVYNTQDKLTISVIPSHLPKDTISGEKIILQNKYGDKLTINVSISGGLGNEFEYEFSSTTASVESNGSSITIHSCKKTSNNEESLPTPLSYSMQSIGYVKYDIWEKIDGNWVKSPNYNVKSDSEDRTFYFYDSIEDITDGTYAIIPSTLPTFTDEASYVIRFTQLNSEQTIDITVTHSKTEKAVLKNIDISFDGSKPTSATSASTSYTVQLMATYEYSGKTYSGINISTQEQIQKNLDTYPWLTGKERVFWDASVGTTITQASDDTMSWKLDANGNSYDMLRVLIATYQGKSTKHELYQDNGDGGLSISTGTTAGSGGTEVLPSKYYTFSVSPTSVPSEGGQVIFDAILYEVDPNDPNNPTTTDITSQVTWYCNNERLEEGLEYYIIPENPNITEIRTYVFSTQYSNADLQGPQTITVTQESVEEIWGNLNIDLSNAYGPDITLQQQGAISVVDMRQTSSLGNERTLAKGDFDLTKGTWEVHQGLKILRIEDGNKTCIVELDKDYFDIEQEMQVSIYFEYTQDGTRYVGTCSLNAIVDLNDDGIIA